MRPIRKIPVLLPFLFMFSSCEKVVVIELNEANQQRVVEAELSSHASLTYVKLSKTASFYGTDEFEKIQNAVVKISGSNGSESIFSERNDEPGTYYPFNPPFLVAVSGITYTLSINTAEGLITAVSSSPTHVPLDSITVEPRQGPFGHGEYLIRCHFTDPGEEENFYRFKIYWANWTNYFQVISDELINGISTDFPLFRYFPDEGDSVVIEMMCIDKATYLYFNALEEAAEGGGPFSAAPGNPLSNMEGTDVIGYFGTNTVSYQGITIK